jgi:glycerol kinase
MYILSIDQGTTGSTVSIVDQKGQIVAQSSEDFEQLFPRPGWVEHNPEDLWRSVENCIKNVLSVAKLDGSKIKAIGITNQRETTILWDSETHQPVCNAIVWQCRRTQSLCEALKKQNLERKFKAKTGLVLDPYFSGTKINWILKNVDQAKVLAKKGKLRAGTVDTFLLWKLTGGESFKTDVSNASRTLLMNIKTLQWDEELLKILSVPRDLLPEISDSSGLFGKTKGLQVLPDGIPITGMAGDQQAALFGQACFSQGEAKCTYGTGSFILINTGSKMIASKAKLLTTVAWKLPKQKTVYALEGGAFICGAAVQWLRDGLQIISASHDIEDLAKSVSSSEGVYFVPALTGLGAPHWRAEARGIIGGLTRGSTKAHIARATLQAMAFQNTDIFEAMQKDLGKKIKAVKVDGGASANNLLMQMQADSLGAKVVRPKNVESTSMGAAFLAGLGVGFWNSTEEIQKIWIVDQVFKSKISFKQKKSDQEFWKNAVKKCIS